MTEAAEHQQLRNLENQMSLLIQIRNERKRTAELQIKKANVEFDRQAIPLARKINELRDQLEDQAPAPREHRPQASGRPDPEWSDEDAQHYRELLRRNGR